MVHYLSENITQEEITTFVVLNPLTYIIPSARHSLILLDTHLLPDSTVVVVEPPLNPQNGDTTTIKMYTAVPSGCVVNVSAISGANLSIGDLNGDNKVQMASQGSMLKLTYSSDVVKWVVTSSFRVS